MKKVIHIPKTNIIQLNKTSNSAFPSSPSDLSTEDGNAAELKKINIVSNNMINIKDAVNKDKNFEANQKDADQNNFSNDLDTPGSKLKNSQENSRSEKKKNNYDSPDSNTDSDERE